MLKMNNNTINTNTNTEIVKNDKGEILKKVITKTFEHKKRKKKGGKIKNRVKGSIKIIEVSGIEIERLLPDGIIYKEDKYYEYLLKKIYNIKIKDIKVFKKYISNESLKKIINEYFNIFKLKVDKILGIKYYLKENCKIILGIEKISFIIKISDTTYIIDEIDYPKKSIEINFWD
jgi:hypothetical protein